MRPDSSVSGSRFGIQASPSLAHLARKAAEELPHPTIANKTLWQARLDTGVLFGAVDEEALNVWEQEHGTPLLEEGDLPPSDSLAAAIKGGNPINANGVSVRSASTGIRPLGSGSDYTVFLQRIGVASTNGGFGSTLHDPVYHYHSVFDSNPWQERYGDPGFLRHVRILNPSSILDEVVDVIARHRSLFQNTSDYSFCVSPMLLSYL